MKENEESVRDFLDQLDVFLFFPEWSREEPWSRVVAEAMVSGCPIIALDRGGTKDQVLKMFESQDVIGVFVAPEIKNPTGKGVTSPLQKRNIMHSLSLLCERFRVTSIIM